MQESSDLAQYLKNRAGSALRGVWYYEDDDIETVYASEAVKNSYGEDDLQQVASMMSRDVNRDRIEGTVKLGEFRVSLYGFSEGVILHFPRGGGSGTVVSLEAEAASQFNEFVENCAKRIYER